MQSNDIYELDVICQVMMILFKQQKDYLELHWLILNPIMKKIKKNQKLKQSKESQNYFIGNGLIRINMTNTYVLDYYLILEYGTIFYYHT